MQWTFYRVLAAPKDIGLPISTACARLLILSVQVRLLIVGPASCILQGCMVQCPGPCQVLAGSSVGVVFGTPDYRFCAISVAGSLQGETRIGKRTSIGVVFATPGIQICAGCSELQSSPALRL